MITDLNALTAAFECQKEGCTYPTWQYLEGRYYVDAAIKKFIELKDKGYLQRKSKEFYGITTKGAIYLEMLARKEIIKAELKKIYEDNPHLLN